MKTKIKHVLNADKSWNYEFRNISGPNSLRIFFSVPIGGQFLSELMNYIRRGQITCHIDFDWAHSVCVSIMSKELKLLGVHMRVPHMIDLVFWKLSFLVENQVTKPMVYK